MRSEAKQVDQSSSFWYLRMNGFGFVPNTSEVSKSEPTYPHSILMQEPKAVRKKKIEPEIYMDVMMCGGS